MSSKIYIINMQYKCATCGRQFQIAFPADGEWEQADGECWGCGDRYHIEEYIPSAKQKCFIDYGIETDELIEDKELKPGEKWKV